MSTPGLDALGTALHATPAAGLEELSDELLTELALLVTTAEETQRLELHASLDEALAVVPRPVRAAVRRAVGL
ncbi:hypothetical protein [Nocardioides sp.]|uniref:hypothetical protein n=1 Tax=Nocardioides sp. TaxID=35761 RepID=UPI002C2B4294|nr:hypothetical protein [Nocardioides sp.]HSX69257.1 hypothetical protein [Nocardioides sp.]